VEYLRPTAIPEICWVVTSEGAAVAEADKPAQRVCELLETEPEYYRIYRIVLERASQEGGTNQRELGILINNDPAAQEPRMYAMGFVERLSEAGAVEWRDRAWRITDAGRLAFSALDEAEASVLAEIEDSGMQCDLSDNR